MTLPPGFHNKGGGCSASNSASTPTICRLVKSLYGLR